MAHPDLAQFWKKLNRKMHVHPEDSPFLHFPKKPYTSYQHYISDYLQNKVNDSTLHSGLLPVPYIGNIESATVYILMLNPGFSHDDYIAESKYFPNFRKALKANLKAKSPFLFLHPDFLWTGGGRYWEKRFAIIAKELLRKKKIAYKEALKLISEKVACIELFPYHSKKFSVSANTLNQLPSSQKAKAFVQKYVIQRAKRREALLIVRGNKFWEIEESAPNIVIIKSRTVSFKKIIEIFLEYIS
ncbi:hypothetical protein A3A67_00840 [Candidatus Peribacteria bacterium RIFCSPLOWO2_01_FULL_51_18]|nr:MAG: hypothetical protein A3C52_01540 [Candidatus Peribacteria bacterium RIFCSPHIGHO2_02_FULL_51_15]OGJ65848.1 MAG: hypothetical protein A3A67_00840 [Candidatus Peribacteria bacterium RIFCSPLOWO2_01_FULL_51_18]